MRHDDVDLDDLAAIEAARIRSETHLSVRLDADAVQVSGDRDRLTQVLRNITDNAVRYARTTVAISVRGDSDEAELGVEDDGPGIPEQHRARVLERFVRLDADRSRPSGGSGLGLAITAEIVRAHGGTMHLATSRFGGAAVRVRLPRSVPQPVGLLGHPPSASSR